MSLQLQCPEKPFLETCKKPSRLRRFWNKIFLVQTINHYHLCGFPVRQEKIYILFNKPVYTKEKRLAPKVH